MSLERFHYKTLDEVIRRAQELGIVLPFAQDCTALCRPLSVNGCTFTNRMGIAPMEGADPAGAVDNGRGAVHMETAAPAPGDG